MFLKDLKPFKLFSWVFTKDEQVAIRKWTGILASKSTQGAAALLDQGQQVQAERAIVAASGSAAASSGGPAVSTQQTKTVAKQKKKEDDAQNMMKFFKRK